MADDHLTVVPFDGTTTVDITPDLVLQSAVGQLESVVLMGYDNNGNLYLASSLGDDLETLRLTDKLRRTILHGEHE